MNLEHFIAYCESKSDVIMEFPFGPETLVFKVHSKIFALTGIDSLEFKVNLKCDPEYAEELRSEFEEVQPGFHMNKKHWNTVHFEGRLGDQMLKKLIDHSYNLVAKPKSKKK